MGMDVGMGMVVRSRDFSALEVSLRWDMTLHGMVFRKTSPYLPSCRYLVVEILFRTKGRLTDMKSGSLSEDKVKIKIKFSEKLESL